MKKGISYSKPLVKNTMINEVWNNSARHPFNGVYWLVTRVYFLRGGLNTL